jgi:hypothetical protein
MNVTFKVHIHVMLHTSVVVRNQQNNQLRKMTEVGSIVLISLFERQVYKIEHNEGNTDS